jgi:hypothetical protein
MFIKTYTTFPEKMLKIKDLISPDHVSKTYSDIFDMIKTKELKVINQ